MKLSRQSTIGLVITAAAVAVLATLFIVRIGGDEPAPLAAEQTASGEVVRENSHRLDTAKDGHVTLVEFLDFECEACGAFYPAIEELRKTYAGQITFVVRYFPIPSHRNALNAALAVESAAQQDQFEAMYKRMFETQSEWGESQDSKAKLFRTFAEDLGLDMEEYDRDVAAQKTKDRVALDQADGTAIGVTGTPTLLLNGKKLELTTKDALYADIDKALND